MKGRGILEEKELNTIICSVCLYLRAVGNITNAKNYILLQRK